MRMRGISKFGLFGGGSAAVMATLLAATPVAAQEQARPFNIPAGDLGPALNAFARQSDREILFTSQSVAGKTSKGVHGRFEARVALDRLLAGSGLQARTTSGGQLVVEVGGPQQQGAQEGSAGMTAVEEVVVTAQKRSENVQDVPASVSVLSGVQLENMSATRLTDYAAYVPGLIIDTEGTPGQARITLRGMSPITSTSQVGTYIDDAPLGSSAGWARAPGFALDLMPYDVARVEVLRGPQGTLYGANTMGGLLKYVTISPDPSRFEGRVGAELSTIKGAGDLGYGSRASFNAPLVDGKLALRASYFDQHTPGYIDNGLTGEKDENAVSQEGGRLSLLWKPADNVSLKLAAMAQNIRADGNAAMSFDIATHQPLFGDLTSSHALPQPFTQHLRYYTATLNWDLGWADFISATSYADTKTTQVQDATIGIAPLFPIVTTVLPQYTGGVVVPPGLSDFRLDVAMDKVTQEFRLASPSGGRTEWLLGAFYTYEDTTMTQTIRAMDLTGAIIPGLNPLVVARIPSSYREIAGFGNFTYRFTDAFDVTAGVRWGHNSQHNTQINSGPLVVLTGGSPLQIGRSAEDVFTYSFSPRYHLNADTMIYGRIASGYRPGGPNTALAGIPPQVNSDSIVSYEAGIKSQFLDRRALFDLAVFRIDWKDIQAYGRVGQVSYLANGGKAKSQGVELTTGYSPVSGLQLGFNAAYTDASLIDDIPSLSGFAGDPLPYTPKWAASFTLDYQFPLQGDWTGRVGGGYRYVGDRSGTFPHDPLHYQAPSYTALDLNASVSNERFTVRLFAKNVTDERAVLSAAVTPDPFNTPVQIDGSILQPRTFGVSIDARF